MTEMSLRFIQESDPEWERMWQALGQLDMNRDMPQPTVCFDEDTAEAWQYMGTAKVGRAWMHEFRHRCHPTTKERTYVRVPMQGKWLLAKGGE
jgi:hypothetical protein